jgi:N-acetylmuramic acid 6-phosphate etherase
MIDMQLSNNKLINRGVEMLMNEINIDYDTACLLLKKHGSVRDAVINYNG